LDVFLDYIDFLHPDLKDRLTSLSTLLLGILENELPPGKLVLKTYTVDRLNELRGRTLNELFQFATSTDAPPVERAKNGSAEKTDWQRREQNPPRPGPTELQLQAQTA
jgi:hypothetical protein